MDNVNIHNIVSARGDALAMQFFPSNEVTIGKNIDIIAVTMNITEPESRLNCYRQSFRLQQPPSFDRRASKKIVSGRNNL